MRVTITRDGAIVRHADGRQERIFRASPPEPVDDEVWLSRRGVSLAPGDEPEPEPRVWLPVLREAQSPQHEPRIYPTPVRDAILAILRDAPASLGRLDILLAFHQRYPRLAGEYDVKPQTISNVLHNLLLSGYGGLSLSGTRRAARWLLDLDAVIESEPPREEALV